MLPLVSTYEVQINARQAGNEDRIILIGDDMVEDVGNKIMRC